MSSDPNPLGPAYRAARRQVATAQAALYRARRALFVFRLRVLGVWHRSKVDVDIAPDLKLGRGVRAVIDPRTKVAIRIGPRTRIDDRVLFLLHGGTLDLGPDTWLRRDVLINLTGHFEMVDSCVLSWGVTVHCAESVRLEHWAGVAERVTITDSSHYFTEKDVWFYQNTRTAPVVIGANTWVCPNATVSPGVRIGDHCIVAPNSVAISDVPDGHLASGVPARDFRPLPLPWLNGERDETVATTIAESFDD